MEVVDYLDRGADIAPEADCFVMGDRHWSYAESRQQSRSIAAALLRDGLRPSAKAAVLSPNRPEAFLCVMGLLRAHLVWLPINPKYSLEDIIQLLARFECEALFLHSEFEAAVPTLRARLTRLKIVVGVDRAFADVPAIDGWSARPEDWIDLPAAGREDLAAIMATGGTTGRPKGIMQSHRGLETYVANHLATMPASSPPRYLVAAPMTHAAGLICLPMFVRAGTTFVIENATSASRAPMRFDVGDHRRLPAAHRDLQHAGGPGNLEDVVPVAALPAVRSSADGRPETARSPAPVRAGHGARLRPDGGDHVVHGVAPGRPLCGGRPCGRQAPRELRPPGAVRQARDHGCRRSIARRW